MPISNISAHLLTHIPQFVDGLGFSMPLGTTQVLSAAHGYISSDILPVVCKVYCITGNLCQGWFEEQIASGHFSLEIPSVFYVPY